MMYDKRKKNIRSESERKRTGKYLGWSEEEMIVLCWECDGRRIFD